MAVATRHLQTPAAPLPQRDAAAGGLRRARLDSVGPSGPDSREAQRRVLEAAVEAGDLAATLAAIARLTGAPAVLQDPFLAVVAAAPDAGADIALNRFPDAPDDILDGGDATRPCLMELPKQGSTPPRLVARVAARGEVLGFLVVAAVDRVAYATLETAAPVVALLLQAEERLCRLLDRDQRELFLDLVAGRSPDCLVIQSRRLGHDLSQPHWPVALRAEGGAGTRTGAEDADPGDAPGRLERIVSDALRDSRPAAPAAAPIVGADGDTVVVFLPEQFPGGPGGLAGRVQTLAARRGLTVVAGWGPRCDDLGAYAAGVSRARWVVDVLAGMPGEPVPTGYDELGIYALLWEKRDRDQLADFADRWLGRLQEHAELTHTLRILLEAGGPSAAAATLFVHISTLKYRLRKIESILGVALSDPEVCFNLRLAFKIRAVHEQVNRARA